MKERSTNAVVARRFLGKSPRAVAPSKATEHLLEESRMVLPGMHALFGFQLIAVFNSSFDEKLAPLEKHLHLLSIGLVVIAIAIIMTPAAFHRQTSPRSVSTRLIDISTRLILTSMVPLAVAICLDFYVVTSLIVSWVFAASLAVVLLVIYGVLWFLMPWLSSRSTRRLR